MQLKYLRFNWFLWWHGVTFNGYRANRYHFEFDDGWISLVKNLIKELKKAGWDGQILYTKEKFGGLRFDAGGYSDIISKYEDKSFETCEVCGEEGRTRDRGEPIGKHIWLKTVCDKHFEEWLKS